MQERLQLLVHSLVLGALLLLVAGWAGAVVLFELGVITLVAAVVSILSGSVVMGLTLLATPPAFAAMAGAWIVTLVALPALAQALARRPETLAWLAPVVGALVGGLVIALQLSVPRGMANVEPGFGARFVLAGVFAGFVVGAIFGRQVGRYLRAI